MALTDEAIEKIKNKIVSGELRPGDPLPKLSELATELGLSRNSLREAVRALSLVRVLDVRQGAGTYVTALQPEVLLEALTFVLEFHRDDSLAALFEVRRILETAAAGLAATHISKESLAQLKGLLDDMRLDAPIETLIKQDIEFHRVLALGSGNQVLSSILDGLVPRTMRVRTLRGYIDETINQRSLHGHRMIYNCIASHNAEAASAWMTIHVSDAEEWLHGIL